jgi:hypothetical protein
MFDTVRIAVELDGKVHEIDVKPRHSKAIQRHYKDDEPGQTEQLLYLAWLGLCEQNVWTGDFDSFVDAADDVGLPEVADAPKV